MVMTMQACQNKLWRFLDNVLTMKSIGAPNHNFPVLPLGEVNPSPGSSKVALHVGHQLKKILLQVNET